MNLETIIMIILIIIAASSITVSTVSGIMFNNVRNTTSATATVTVVEDDNLHFTQLDDKGIRIKSPSITYEYTVSGKSYSNTIDQPTTQKWTIGDKITVYYNPSSADENTIEKSSVPVLFYTSLGITLSYISTVAVYIALILR
jgi:hypothetical protein